MAFYDMLCVAPRLMPRLYCQEYCAKDSDVGSAALDAAEVEIEAQVGRRARSRGRNGTCSTGV